MLPWKKNKEGSVSAPVDRVTREHDEGAEFDTMEAAAFDLKEALKKDDIQAIAAALDAAIELKMSKTPDEGSNE